MAQYEIQRTDAEGSVHRVRARSVDEAVRRVFDLTETADVKIAAEAEFSGLEGWSTISVAGIARGRIRPFSRMKFRRE